MTIAYDNPLPFTLERPGSVPLSFNGWMLASESSEHSPRRRYHGAKVKEAPRPGKPQERWTEVRIYLTETGFWIAEYLGCSRVEGEVTIRRVTICEEPGEVLDAVRHAGSGNIPGVAARALRAAAGNDNRLNEALEEHI